jgi:methylphosphotriester-DNA--protein-cysteine methyltransferase
MSWTIPHQRWTPVSGTDGVQHQQLGDAAFGVGFQNPFIFIAVFRKQFGVTPARFFDDGAG